MQRRRGTADERLGAARRLQQHAAAPLAHDDDGDDAKRHAALVQQVHTQSGSTLRGALRAAVETEETGAATLACLTQQREQLQRTSDTLAQIDDTLTLSERTIKSMASWSGRISDWFKGAAAADAGPVALARRQRGDLCAADAVGGAVVVLCVSLLTFRKPGAHATGALANSSSKAAVVAQRVSTVRKSSRDRDLDALSSSVASLGAMAQTMNEELVLHNRILDGISADVDTVQSRLKKQNQDLRSLG